MKTLTKSTMAKHNLLPDCAFRLGHLLMYIPMSQKLHVRLLCLRPNLSKSGNVLFSQMEIVCSVQHHCHWGEITHWCRNFEWWSCWVELHINATYAQHPALKSVYGRDQSVIAISYFPPIGQFSAQGLLEIPRQVAWIASMKHLPRKKH